MADNLPPAHLHIGFSFVGRPKVMELVPAFDNALDWIRYGDTNWVVWTNSSEKTWYARIKPRLAPQDHVLIIKIDPHGAFGWLPNPVWDWLNSEKSSVRVEPAIGVPGRRNKRGF